MIVNSNTEQSSVTSQSEKECKSSDLDLSTSDVTNISQQAINVQILQQLQSLVKRLDSMEASSYKKGTDSQNIKNKYTKTKSAPHSWITQLLGHLKTFKCQICNQLCKMLKERVQYDHLSITQWVADIVLIMREELNLETRQNKSDYMIVLMDDANDFSGMRQTASHAILLCRMEQGEIKHYGEVDKIDRVEGSMPRGM